MPYRKPNILIVGCQKCGTTWLHSTLGKFPNIFASEVKELNFFNKKDFAVRSDAYLRNFPVQDGAELYLESTPHYFQAPNGTIDVAGNIKSFLGDPKIIVIFRNPVERYESAYIHHMMKDRIPFSETISEVSDEYKMASLGYYSEILPHWREVFPDIIEFFYDDIKVSNTDFVNSVLERLGIEDRIPEDDINFRTNDKSKKANRLGDKWQTMPKITSDLRNRLIDHYSDGILELQKLTGRDLSHWLQ